MDVKVMGNMSTESRQLYLAFASPYSDLAIKEAVRGVKAIMKECIRLGIPEKSIKEVMRKLDEENSIVGDAFEAMSESLE